MDLDNHQPCDGLDFIVEHPEYVAKLATALNAIGPTAIRVRKQMFELLAALCAHNEDGRIRTLETLDYYKKLKKQKYRMAFIVQELEQARTTDYQTALVAFINCLIISTSNLIDRIRIRNEFFECQLLQVLNKIRNSKPEPDLSAQIDVFDEQHKSDQSEHQIEFKSVDLDSPLDIFYAILKKVADTSHAAPFLSILQSLLSIDPDDPLSDIIWENLEKLVQKAIVLDKHEDIPKLARLNSRTKLNCTCQQSNSNRRQSGVALNTPYGPLSPPPPNSSSAPPPPPFPQAIPPPPPPIAPPHIPPPPPPNQAMRKNLPPDKEPIIELLPQQEIPAPKSKMKTVNWNKIPSNKVVGTNNIWTQVAHRHQNSPLADIDWSEMEGLFCQQGPAAIDNADNAGNNEERCLRKTRNQTQEITLLDGKRSLNVNIFLKQFRSSNEDIIRLIRNGEHDKIGIEKLKGLLKILPEVDELDMLKSFKGDVLKLGNAENFLMQLTSLSNYKLRIESMLLKEEFESNMSYVKPSINSMVIAAQELMTNKALQEVLYMVLIAGNFLNAGGYAANAAGVKLTSLQKIMDIRANKPNMNLIHFVAQQAEKRGNVLLSFTDNIGILEDAAKTTVEQLKNEISTLEERIRKIKKQIELPVTEPEIKEQMTEFLLMATNDVSNLQKELKKLDTVRKQLAEFFCEDLSSFKIEECFRIFHTFTCKFKQAVIENERRKYQEEQANARKRQREELLAAKRRQMENINGSDDGFIEMQIYGSGIGNSRKSFNGEDEFFATSPLLPRHRLSSFNGNGMDNEKDSPDSSPNGSLRRRRTSKGMIDDQGNLMDFLRNSSDCSNRERRSWGSLDRSWARKAKGTGPKKRPNLLTADFLLERDRTTTPSPVIEVKGSCSAPEEESLPKIESRLKHSESNLETKPKDKSAWRKSTLNVPNSTEEIRNSHRRESHNNMENSRVDILQPIMESNDRKELIGSLGKNMDKDSLTLYIRRPTLETEPKIEVPTIKSPVIVPVSPEPPIIYKPFKDSTLTNNKIDIDQDNVQTPPMLRKTFISPTPTERREVPKPSPCKRILNAAAAESREFDLDIMGDGQFNRFSPTRRTRRQVRTQQKSPPKLLKEKSPEDDKALLSTSQNSILGDFVSPVYIKVDKDEEDPKVEYTPSTTKSSRYSISDLPVKVDKTFSINSLDPSPAKTKSNNSTIKNPILRTNSIVDKNAKNAKNLAPIIKPTLRRNVSITNPKTKMSNSSENFIEAKSNNVKRSASISTAPVSRRSQPMGFMKPTTSSTTKSSAPTTRRSFSIRGRN
ncbi:unnamed protein product [Ceutorhynchus assimilis]|uniref:Inverted formin-2 n=1 Tax=Ceutorhynchus assimilis TaxID=467358 RepID=A0A9N9QCW3_9CUCU|nr:unnamed protein product [Ceutorhynchus assimilis]